MNFPDIKYPVVEMFHSVQGEGTHAGVSSVFIRFYGCNLVCDFGEGHVCDAPLHRNADAIQKLNVFEMSKFISKANVEHVVFTGGEPTIQPHFDDLIKALQRQGYYVQVETNGANMEKISNVADWITYSPKVAFGKAPLHRTGFDELKLLAGVHKPVDTELWNHVPVKFVQPIGWEKTWDEENVKYCFEFVKANPEWRLSLQIQKPLGVD